MADFASPYESPGNRLVLAPTGNTPLGDLTQTAAVGFGVTATTWTANRAVYLPVVVEWPMTITHILTRVQTQAGNLDVGIYTWNGARVVSSGSTAVAAAGVQLVDIADTTLSPGWYFMAFSCDSSTAAFKCNNTVVGTLRMCGIREQASAFALPATATFANYATALIPQLAGVVRAAG